MYFSKEIHMREYWSEEEFQNPSSEFRGAPFWAWNNKLDVEQLKEQVSYFKEMGMGGYHIHCRVGLDTPYLGEEFMQCVESCIEEGKKQGLYTYLYDEDRWPSGAAGGIVTREEKYRSRYLYFVPEELDNEKKGRLLGQYSVLLKNGYLEHYEYFKEKTKKKFNENGGVIWNLYLRIAESDPWFNNQTYVDTLNGKAIERFIEVTHEKYYKKFGKEFGKVIPSIFTDEPQFRRKETLDFADEKKGLVLPSTDGFEEYYKEKYGESFLEHFPEVIWELPGGEISSVRYQYHDGIAELFATSFADNLGKWCGEHQLMLTGHMMEEPTLLSQTSALGEAMRSYRAFQQPGIDMLCDWREYTTAKQAQSATHQYGCLGVLSELYGVTNWDFDFRGHKLQGDWQAALGVTRRVHHLAWASMAGEAKRDYPASIFYQSPWYKEYNMVEDHFARVNTALMRGNPHVRVGVIHPIESYWLHFGPKEQTAQIREVLETNFQQLTEWLLFGMIDFDYVAESLLESQVREQDGYFYVGQMKYDVILVPGCETLRATTVCFLEKFVYAGGKVVFCGKPAGYVDAKSSNKVKEFAEKCMNIPFDKIAVLETLEEVREIEVRRSDGQLTDQFLYQMRDEGENRWIFIANGKKPDTQDISQETSYRISIKGEWKVQVCDTNTGEVLGVKAEINDGWTTIRKIMDMHDSLLLRLVSGEDGGVVKKELIEVSVPKKEEEWKVFPQPVEYELDEPNVLLLDQCEYSLDGEEWREKEEILRIDNTLRTELGYPKRMEAWPQPWVQKEETGEHHRIEMRFSVWSEIICEKVYLALEDAKQWEIVWNGKKVSSDIVGWFVDKSILKVQLPGIQQGENILVLKRTLGKKTNLEWCYLLGEFGVRVAGRAAWLVKMPERLLFGDYTIQGLPFYAGNVKYRIKIETDAGNYKLQISKYRAPLLKVSVDGGKWKRIAYAPYEVDLGYMNPGSHWIEIISFGNRVNAFGTIHDCDETTEWYGPNEWRTEKERYAYEYQLRRMGVLKTPEFKKTETIE